MSINFMTFPDFYLSKIWQNFSKICLSTFEIINSFLTPSHQFFDYFLKCKKKAAKNKKKAKCKLLIKAILTERLIHFHSISIFILLTHWKAMEAPYIGRAITLTCFRRCQDIAVLLKFVILVFQIYRDMTEIQNCLLRPSSREKCCKVSFSRTQQNKASRF